MKNPVLTGVLAVLAVVTAALAAPAPARAAAAESGWAATPEARARLVSGVSATGVEGAAPFGLEFVLKEGWKAYWRAPGPQGYPPRLDWTGSENLADARIVWPQPHRFTILGYDSIGYKNGVTLPLQLRFADPAQPAKLRLVVDYLTCAEICIPQTAELALDLPAGPAEPTSHAFAIDRARGQAPAPPGAGARIERAWLAGPTDTPSLVAEVAAAGADPAAVDLFMDGLSGYFFAAPKVERIGDGRLRLTAAALEAPETPAAVGAEASYVLSLGDRAIEQTVALIAPPAALAPASRVPTAASAAAPGFLLMLGVALLGGLILNVMPCVLPVLGIKLMGALKHAEAGRAAVRRGFLASAAGIVVSFAALAAGAVALKAGGVAVGWGMQFQQPLFVAGMAVVMTLFAANLWGAFEFATPEAANRASARLPSDGSGAGGHGWGAFWTGVLATALATPCSAPFVGVALGFALSRGAVEIVSIFLAMGVGLAAPYLLTAAVPSVARALPRPGRWMAHVRWFMGAAVAATGAWLLWVLWRQTGTVAAAAALAAGLVAVAAIVWGRGLRWGYAAGALAAGLAAVWLTAAPTGMAARESGAPAIAWVGFDEAEISRRVAAGEVVLVDVTAEWCVTCKWNKAAVLSQAPVADLFAGDVTPMQADWTRPDPAIGAYLAKFGRYGIPFNAVYGPGAPDGLPLPELLNDDVVLDAVKKAQGLAG